MKRLLLVVVFLLVAPATHAATWNAKVEVLAASPNKAFIAHVERAITRQVNDQVDPHWGTPNVRFVSSGPYTILVRLENPGAIAADCGEGDDGCHSLSANGTIVLDVNRWAGCQGYTPGHCDGFQEWSPDLSHEMIEGLVDPTGGLWSRAGLLEEPCDPVQGSAYAVEGIQVSDFVFPRWFVPGTTGQQDWLSTTRHPQQLGYDGDELESNGNYLGGASDLS